MANRTPVTDRLGAVGWRRGLEYRRSRVMPAEGRGLSSRRTQDVARGGEIGQPSNSDQCSEAADGVTRLPRYDKPLRHPVAPGLPVTGVRLIVPDHASGLPVLRALSLCTCCRHYPGTATGGTALLIQPVMVAFPGRVAGSACASSISRLAQRSLALRPAHSRCHRFVARLPEGFSHFVTSMTAPVASGWSGCRAGLAPAGKRRLCTAHTHG